MARSFQITSLFPYLSVMVNAMIGLQGVDKSRYGFFRPLFKDKALTGAAQELLESTDLWDLKDEIVELAGLWAATETRDSPQSRQPP